MIDARIAILLILAAPSAAGGPAPRVKVEVSPKQGAWVGQRVALTITVSTPDLFAGVPAFEIPAVSGAIVVPPSGSPDVGSEQVGETSFTTQRHQFAVYPQRPGTFRIPPFPIRFESNAGYGKPTVQRRVTTEEVSFSVKNPPGSEGLGTVVAARDLKLTVAWQPEPKAAKVGDAFTLSVTVTASGVPGMIFPPMQFGPIDGVSTYRKEPVVIDRADRGEITGQRTDAMTLVCERRGAVSIPDHTLTWFDLDAGKLKRAILPGRTFDVLSDPRSEARQPSSSALAQSERGRWWPMAVAVVTVMVGWRLFRRMRPWWDQTWVNRAESEAAYFARFRRACLASDAQSTYTALLCWLDHAGPCSLNHFTDSAADPLLTKAVNDLRARLYSRGDPRGPWPQARELFARTKLARRRFRGRRTPAETDLPPLNPSR